MDKKVLIWMDPNISDEENEYYQKMLKVCIPESYFFDNVDNGIEQLKLVYFKYTVIILSCQFYDYFYTRFQNNLKHFYSLSKVYIFTSEGNKYLVNEGLYNYQRKIYYIDELINEINKPHLIELQENSIQSELYNINEMYECKVQELTFDIVNQLEDMIFPIFFKNIITDFDYKEQKKFQENVYKDYSSNENVKDLLLPIFDYKSIPIELLSKIYARLYTIDSDFYFQLNSKLKEGYGKEYIPFIKCLYEGINSKTLNSYFSKQLYRGSNIEKSEFDRLNKIIKNKNNFPKLIVFSRAFLSFSEDISVALQFINKKKNCYEILYEIEKPKSQLDISLCSNADIGKITFFNDEKEILFFPGSIFEVINIEEKERIKKIKLCYLGKYKKQIKIKYLHNNCFQYMNSNTKFYKFTQQKSNKEEEKKNENLSLFSFSNLEKKINKSLIKNLDSKIIKTEKENNFIKKLISPSINIELKLLYRKSIDGDSFETFHNKCDNIKENIIFVKSKEGIKFGGYYPNNWESLDNEVQFFCNDVKLFNIREQKIFSYKTNIKYNIIKSKNNGPNFTADFSFSLVDMNMCCSCGDDAFLDKKNLANNKVDYFLVDEVEVFQIIYEDLEDELTNGFSKEICINLDKETTTNDSSYPIDSIKMKESKTNDIHNLIQLTSIETIKQKKNNFILCYYNIKTKDVNKEIQLINYFSKTKKDSNYELSGIENEVEIKNKCENYLKNQKIGISHRFKEEGIYSIKIECKNPLININFMFSNCNSLISINFCHFKSISLNNTSFLFNQCNYLENIDFSNFNTSNIINMSHMFGECESIKILNLNDFNTKNVTNMSEMFFCCYKLEHLNIKSFNTHIVTKMNHMFFQCNSLKELNINHFVTNNVLDMSFMFFNCNSLKKLQIKINTEKCINMEYMFAKCSSLISLDLSKFNTLNVTNMNSMFSQCESLIYLNLNNFDTRKVKNMENMFNNCVSLINLMFSNSLIDNVEMMNNLFHNCFKLEKLDITKFKLPPNMIYKNIFSNINKNCILTTNDITLQKEFLKTIKKN